MRKMLLLCTFLFMLALGSTGQETNLVSNPSLKASMASSWQHEGAGVAEFLQKTGGVRLTGGKFQGFIDLDNMEHSDPANTVPCDRIYRLTVQAKGQGQFRIGVRSLIMTGKFATEFVETWSEPQQLTDNWQNFTLEQQEKKTGCIFHDKVMVEYLGNQELLLNSFSFNYLDKKDFKIQFEPNHAIAAPGDQVKVKIHTDKIKMPLRLCLYSGHTRIGQEFTEEEKITDENGDINYTVNVPATCKEGMRLAVSDPITGVKRSFFVTLTAPETIKKLKENANKISGKKHFLFLGDSLTKYDSGRNYVDIIGGLLPAGCTVRNAGVGGDYSERVWLRLNGKKTTRNEMYDNLFEPKPDVIFLFLGANDTKTPSSTGYKVPITTPDMQYKLFKQIFAYLKEKSNAEIVIISATSSYFPYQQDAASRKTAAGIPHNLFGIDEHIVNFNNMSQKVAKEENLNYIDVYTRTLNYPDKRQLFVYDDGVHLTLQGHELIATEVLKYLSRK